MSETSNPFDLRDKSAQEIADIRHSIDIQSHLFDVRAGKLSDLVTANEVSERIAGAMTKGLQREANDILTDRQLFDEALPTERLGQEEKTLRENLGRLSLREDIVLGKNSVPNEWLAVFREYGENAPGDVYEIIARQIEDDMEDIRREREESEARLLAYEAISASWIPLAELITKKQTPPYIEKDETVIFDTNKTPANPPQKRNGNFGERGKTNRSASEKIIAFLVENAGQYFSYQDITQAIYEDDGDKPRRQRDNRVGVIFHNNLKNPKQGNAFERFLGDEWVLVRGKRTPIDPETGKPPLKYKPLVCYKVIPRAEAEAMTA